MLRIMNIEQHDWTPGAGFIQSSNMMYAKIQYTWCYNPDIGFCPISIRKNNYYDEI